VPSASGWQVPGLDDPFPPSVVDDEAVSHEVVDPGSVPAQQAALREHRTQVSVGEGCYALSNGIAARLAGREGYARLDPATGALLPGSGAARQTSLLPGEGA
jgi:N-acetyl-1-D-myo-inositol-2-amino-2-deoxy-alpha-D-glucopyranoside deacetylase